MSSDSAANKMLFSVLYAARPMHRPIRINIMPEAVGSTFSPLGGITNSLILDENGFATRSDAGPRQANWSFAADMGIDA